MQAHMHMATVPRLRQVAAQRTLRGGTSWAQFASQLGACNFEILLPGCATCAHCQQQSRCSFRRMSVSI